MLTSEKYSLILKQLLNLWAYGVVFFAAGIRVQIPAVAVKFDIADLYIKYPRAVIDYFYVPWMYLRYCTAIYLFPVR